jgi:predicted secreted acid phosphatase
MNQEKSATEKQSLTPVQIVRGDWKAFVDKISYKGLLGNMPFISFLAVICILYISNNHFAVQVQREMNAQNKKLKELRWKNMDIKSQLMSKQMESQMIKDAALIGLKPLTIPTSKIVMDSFNK